MTPSFDDCSTAEDEDCDGRTLGCSGEHLFSRRLESAFPFALATTSAGEIWVTGQSSVGADFGNGPVQGNTADVFIAKYSPSGSLLLAKVFGDQDTQEAQGIATDAGGGVVIAGTFTGTLDFGGDPLVASDKDIFVARFDAAGNHVWSKRFGGFGEQRAFDVAIDGSGHSYVAGDADGDVDFGGGALSAGGNRDVVVAKLDAAGGHLWSKRAGDGDIQSATSIAVDGVDGVYLGGAFYGSIGFGGPTLTTNNDDAFLVKLTTSGAHVASLQFGNGATQAILALAADTSGALAITGTNAGVIDFGGGPLASAGQTDVFVGKLGATGAHLWSALYGDSDHQQVHDLALDAGGNVVVAGSFHGAISFGGATFVSNGSTDGYVAKLDASGGYLWSKGFGDVGAQEALAVATDAIGRVVLGGAFEGTIALGGSPLVASGADGFLAIFAP